MRKPAIRVAMYADMAGVLALLRQLNPDDPYPDPAKAEAAWSAMLGSGLVTVLVAEVDGSLAATCTLAIIPNLTRGTRPFGIIENVVTHPKHRCQGCGTAVLAAALARAWEAGCYKVMLATGSRKPETLRFYESAGFERGGKTCFQAQPPGTTTGRTQAWRSGATILD
jgi:GNAT superfamily N-acetyltransferase